MVPRFPGLFVFFSPCNIFSPRLRPEIQSTRSTGGTRSSKEGLAMCWEGTPVLKASDRQLSDCSGDCMALRPDHNIIIWGAGRKLWVHVILTVWRFLCLFLLLVGNCIHCNIVAWLNLSHPSFYFCFHFLSSFFWLFFIGIQQFLYFTFQSFPFWPAFSFSVAPFISLSSWFFMLLYFLLFYLLAFHILLSIYLTA